MRTTYFAALFAVLQLAGQANAINLSATQTHLAQVDDKDHHANGTMLTDSEKLLRDRTPEQREADRKERAKYDEVGLTTEHKMLLRGDKEYTDEWKANHKPQNVMNDADRRAIIRE